MKINSTYPRIALCECGNNFTQHTKSDQHRGCPDCEDKNEVAGFYAGRRDNAPTLKEAAKVERRKYGETWSVAR